MLSRQHCVACACRRAKRKKAKVNYAGKQAANRRGQEQVSRGPPCLIPWSMQCDYFPTFNSSPFHKESIFLVYISSSFSSCCFCVCECLLQNNNHKTKHQNNTNCGSAFEPGAAGLPYHCTSICVRSVCSRRASCVDSKPKKKPSDPRKAFRKEARRSGVEAVFRFLGSGVDF